MLGRILLGLVVGASFGVVAGALISSWVYGVAAIEERAVEASWLSAGMTIAGALAGAVIGYRVRLSSEDSVDDVPGVTSSGRAGSQHSA